MEKNLQIEIMSSYFIQLIIYMLSTIKPKLGVIMYIFNGRIHSMYNFLQSTRLDVNIRPNMLA